LASPPVLGSVTDKFTLIYRASDLKWVPTAQKVGNIYTPGAAIPATAFNATSPRQLSAITVPSQPFDYYVRPSAQCAVTGSIDTRVDLFVRLNDPAAGNQLGYSKGSTGVTPPTNVLILAPPPTQVLPGSYGKVLTGNPATFYLRAEQRANSTNAWSTPSDPDTTFCIEVVPVL
jgi:hypothetical protein